MGPGEAEFQANNLEVSHYGQWFTMPDGLIHLTCGDCGVSHSILVRGQSLATLECRIDSEKHLTDAVRETAADLGRLPLYTELIRLREENIQLKREVYELKEVYMFGRPVPSND